MEAIVIRDRYKVVQVLRVQEGYAAVRAVDIQDRETPRRLINLYEGPLLHQYGPLYMKLDRRECPAFRDFFLENGTLAAVFDDCSGTSIDRVFYRGDRWDWRTRMEMAETVLHRAMTLTNLPPEIGCAALLSENLYPDPKDRKLSVRFLAAPWEGMNSRELALLAGDQVKKILPRRWSTQPAQARFLDSLDRGERRTAAALYAWWRETRGAMEEENTRWEGLNVVQKCLDFLKRWFVRRKERKRA